MKHEDRVIQPKGDIPPGSRFKGYRDFVVQELVIDSQNARYRLARWETPDGHKLPSGDGDHMRVIFIIY